MQYLYIYLLSKILEERIHRVICCEVKNSCFYFRSQLRFGIVVVQKRTCVVVWISASFGVQGLLLVSALVSGCTAINNQEIETEQLHGE